MKPLNPAKPAAVASILFALAVPALAATYAPVADTWLQNGSTADNSADSNLRVKNQNNQVNDRVTFIRFDGTEIGGNVTDASLEFTVSAFSTPATLTLQLFGIPNGAANESFNAVSLTFANSGYTDQSADNNVNETLFEGSGPLATAMLLNTSPVGTKVTFTGAGLVNFLNANANADVAFVLTTSTINDSVFLAFGSSENGTAGYKPLLTVVPEPGSIAFVGLGVAGFIFMSKRRQ